MFGQAKMDLGSLFAGKDLRREALDQGEIAEDKQQDLINAVNSISVSRGEGELDTSDFKSPKLWKEMDNVLANLAPNMEKLGLTTEDIIETWDKRGHRGRPEGLGEDAV